MARKLIWNGPPVLLFDAFGNIRNGAVFLDPHNESLPINIDTGTYANKAGLKPVASAVIYPPTNSLFAKGRKSHH